MNERWKNPYSATELFSTLPLKEVSTYTGVSETIKGFQRIREAIGQTPGIKSIDPAILLEDVYFEYKNNDISAGLKKIVQAIWDHLDGDQHPLIVRRLFPDQK